MVAHDRRDHYREGRANEPIAEPRPVLRVFDHRVCEHNKARDAVRVHRLDHVRRGHREDVVADATSVAERAHDGVAAGDDAVDARGIGRITP